LQFASLRVTLRELKTQTPATRSGSGLETHTGSDPRLLLFYPILGLLVLVLVGGLAYRQLFRSTSYSEQEKVQSQRRIVVPAPRGNIYDRNGQLLAGNRPRFGVFIYLDELRREFHVEYLRIRRNYREIGDKDIPTAPQLEQIARYTVVQRYVDQISKAIGREIVVDPNELTKHYHQELLLPFPLVEDLAANEFAELVEALPTRSPLQLFASSTRYYPHGSVASHTLGYVGVNEAVDVSGLPGENLTTFKLKGSRGRDGLEREYDQILQGEPGETIFRVDPAGYRVNPPIEVRSPVQGKDLTSSLDLDLQMVAEDALGDQTGAAVALDVKTGEVLVLASKPDYDLSKFTPFLSHAAADEIEQNNAWTNRAVASFYPPGSTFKILVSIAGMRSGAIAPDQIIADCEGSLRVGPRIFRCDNGHGHHGEQELPEAIASSCDTYFWTAGLKIGVETIAAEARRFHLDQRTGIDLPGEPHRMIIPDTEWKKRVMKEAWFPGDTANMSIGQGYVLMNPLEMACFAASVARGETVTHPTLLHNPNAPEQHSEPIGLTATQRAALLKGMEEVTTIGTAGAVLSKPAMKIPGVRIAGKTGTAQIPGKKDVAWFICFAPLEKPEVAIAVSCEGDTAGEDYAGATYAAPVADLILKRYFENKMHPLQLKVDATPPVAMQ
jgi:penicillin-binding protein 2